MTIILLDRRWAICVVALTLFLLASAVSGQTDEESAAKLLADGKNNVKSELSLTLKIAVTQLSQAASVFERLQLTAQRAESLFFLGQAYRKLKDESNALTSFATALPLLLQIGDRANAGRCRRNMAESFEGQGDLLKAKDYHSHAFEDFVATDFKFGQMVTLTSIGNIETRLKRGDEAIKVYLRAIQLAKDEKNLLVELDISQRLAGVFESLGQNEKAFQAITRAIEVAKELKNPLLEADNQQKSCWLKSKLGGKWQDAVECLDRVVSLARELKDESLELQTLSRKGQLLEENAQDEQALKTINELAGLATKYARKVDLAYAFYNQGYIYFRRRDYQQAEAKYEAALSIANEAAETQLAGMILNQLGHCYSAAEKYSKAEAAFEQSLAISRKLGNKLSIAFGLENLGMLLSYQDKYDRALSFFEEALRVVSELNDKDRQGRILIQIGYALYGTKKYDRILSIYTQALAISKEANNRETETTALERLGAFYLAVRQYRKAIDFFQQSLTVARLIKNRSLEADALLGLADTSLRQNANDDSRKNYEAVLLIAREPSSGYQEASALIGLGILSKRGGSLEKSRSLLEQAIKVAEKDGEIYKVAHASNELAEVLIELNVPLKAIGLAESSLRSGYQTSDDERIVYSLASLMRANYRLNRWEAATVFGKKLINVIQSARSQLKAYEVDLQKSFVQDKEPLYRELSDVLIGQGRLLEAQQVLDLLKEEEFRQIVRSGSTAETVPYSNIERSILDKVERVAILERERSDLEKKSGTSLTGEERARLSNLQRDLDEVSRAFRLSLDSLSKNQDGPSDRLNEIKSERSLQRALGELQNASGSPVVALYTMLDLSPDASLGTATDSKKRSYGWIILVTPSTRKAYPIDVSALKGLVSRIQTELIDPLSDPRPRLNELYRKLFSQTSAKQKTTLESDLATLFEGRSVPTLMWSLDGILRYVPMAALFDGKQYLIEKYQNVVFSKESLLTLTSNPGIRERAVGFGVSESRDEFSALPDVENELRDIVRQRPSDPGVFDGTIKLNSSFTEQEAITTWRDGKYPIVHLASHYKYKPEQPDESFLLVGDGNLTFTEMRDMDNLFGKVDLLTLSACDTATGSANGKEVEGLAYLAQNLGAKSVIATLWPISDGGTREFMRRFYKLMKEFPDKSKGSAFREAQLALIKGGESEDSGNRPARDSSRSRYSHPFYWAPFILVGNWK